LDDFVENVGKEGLSASFNNLPAVSAASLVFLRDRKRFILRDGVRQRRLFAERTVIWLGTQTCM